LHALAKSDLALLTPHLSLVALKQGTIAIAARADIHHVYFPVSGMVSILSLTGDGKALETGIIGKDGIVGGAAGAGINQTTSQAIVQIEGKAFRIDVKHFLQVYEKSPELRRLVARYQAFMLTQAQQTATCHAMHTVNARLARWLLQCSDVVKTPHVNLTQDFLSHMLGVHRSSVSLEAHKLQDVGLIKYSRGRVEILDRRGVQDCACECYEVLRDELNNLMPEK
jgi:CRP-like cAMP-binding protein